jgi:hypothetical protein
MNNFKSILLSLEQENPLPQNIGLEAKLHNV